jgi:hypothetical protein
LALNCISQTYFTTQSIKKHNTYTFNRANPSGRTAWCVGMWPFACWD